ncbi:MAG TPA: CBS domain-containing protein [Candidatus Kapabacteria bacterium]|nr:CBS domain-containing protein [Candidatus Kapabacteria bacterium]
MSSPVARCTPATSLAAAGVEMLRHDCGVLPVVDENRGLVGIITDRDICMAVSTRPQNARDIRVDSAMTAGIRTVSPDDTLVDALATMRAGRVHRVPVIDEHAVVVGMLSIDDIVLLTGSALGGRVGPSCEEVTAALREIHAHWRPHLHDPSSSHPMVPVERHSPAPLAPVMAPARAPIVEPHDEPELEPIEHTSDFDFEE